MRVLSGRGSSYFPIAVNPEVFQLTHRFVSQTFRGSFDSSSTEEWEKESLCDFQACSFGRFFRVSVQATAKG